jgi:sentrin-specific protease 1
LKLAAILLFWKKNTANANDLIEEESNDVTEIPNENGLKRISNETKYESLISILSKMSAQELVGGLCNYIKSINCAETLE